MNLTSRNIMMKEFSILKIVLRNSPYFGYNTVIVKFNV